MRLALINMRGLDRLLLERFGGKAGWGLALELHDGAACSYLFIKFTGRAGAWPLTEESMRRRIYELEQSLVSDAVAERADVTPDS